MTGETALVGGILGTVLILREWQNWRDRRDLMDRIMSADFKEYKRYTKPADPKPEYPVNMTEEQLAEADAKKG